MKKNTIKTNLIFARPSKTFLFDAFDLALSAQSHFEQWFAAYLFVKLYYVRIQGYITANQDLLDLLTSLLQWFCCEAEINSKPYSRSICSGCCSTIKPALAAAEDLINCARLVAIRDILGDVASLSLKIPD